MLMLLISACGGNGSEPSPTENSKDRTPILTNWADNIVIPGYEKFKVSFDAMVTKANAFTTAPDQAKLVEFRAAWSDAYAAWEKVELFEFGPADKYVLRSMFNIYPTDVTGILANINNPSVNTSSMAELLFSTSSARLDDNAFSLVSMISN